MDGIYRRAKLARLHSYVQTLCGVYSRVARKLGVDRSYVSRVAKGERRSAEVEVALLAEFEEAQEKP
ncbi:MAG: hypothetical protein AB7O65_00625 [Candidatus Korobacteraceae bacterium]